MNKRFYWLLLSVAAISGACGAVMLDYAAPRIKERLFPVVVKPVKYDPNKVCTPTRRFSLSRDTTIVRTADTSVILHPVHSEIPEYATEITILESGVINFDLKLEAVHRADGFSDGCGFGAFLSYQYAKTQSELERAPVLHPSGWGGGTNVMNLRDHYGQVNVVGGLAVAPGVYRFCVFASAHSTLTDRTDIAAVLVEDKFGALNSLRFIYNKGADFYTD